MQRLLLGPGPSEVHPRVLAALGRPTIGHLDPVFLEQLDQVQASLRRVFRTENGLTLPISGTGSAGMEACFVNLVEEGDEVIIGINGVFGTRMAEVAARLGAKVVAAEVSWGDVVSPEAIKAALSRCVRPRLVAIVHAETSTGAWQPVPDIASLAHQFGALLVLDTVTSLGGCPVDIDGWKVDASYSGTQKCLSCPPGLSPLTFSSQALARLAERRVKPRSWYFDLSLISGYFGSSRVYHHTAPVNMIFAIDEALRLVFEEGLDARFERHRANHRALLAGLATIDVLPASQSSERLWMLNSVLVPKGADDRDIRGRLLSRHGIEIGGGLGPLAGKVWRIGLMGESSRIENVRRLLACLAIELGSDRHNDAIDAADHAYEEDAGPIALTSGNRPSK